jgi:hypothetical protein
MKGRVIMKTYIGEVKKYYDFIFLCKHAILLTSVLFIIDIFNVPTKMMLDHNTRNIIIFIVLLILFVLLTTIELHLYDAIKLVAVNLIDAITLTIVFSTVLYTGIS